MKHWAKKLLAVGIAGATLLSGCGSIDKSATLVNINDGEDTITLGYGNFVARLMQAEYDSVYRSYYGDTYWSTEMESGNTLEDSVKEQILEMIEEQYVLKQHAADYDVSIDDDAAADIDAAVEEFMSENDEDGIEQLGATEEYVKTMLEYHYIAYQVQMAIDNSFEPTVTDEDAAQKTFSYVFYSTEGNYDSETGETVDLTDDEIAALQDEAAQLATSGDMDTVAAEQDMTVNTQSYGTSDVTDEDYTDFDQTVLAAAEELEEGQMSNVIEVEGSGYYVVRMDSLYDEEATAAKKEELEQEQTTDYYNSLIEEWEDAITWDVDEDAWAKVTFDTLFESAEEEDAEEESAQ